MLTGILNLDLSPKERWSKIMNKYPEKITLLKKYTSTILGQYCWLVKAFQGVVTLFDTGFRSKLLHLAELEYWSDLLQCSLSDIVFLQLLYELNAGCTTVMTPTFFFRTMDWPMSFLKDITIDLEVISKGVHLGRVVTWLGYIGWLTVITPHYGLVVNYRRGSQDYMSLGNRLLTGYWPTGYLVRDIVESRTDDINKVIKRLSTDPLVSGCYYSLYTSKQSHVITRNPSGLHDIISSKFPDSKPSDNTVLICTNCDRDKTSPNIMMSIERRNLIASFKLDHWKELLCSPIINHETVYYTVLEGDTLITAVV